ncbi:hypothetical protein VD0003_g3978 [Verticillium dahliae]|nr:hypothetical protein VD0003_g3978 [Verticillium dahliae]
MSTATEAPPLYTPTARRPSTSSTPSLPAYSSPAIARQQQQPFTPTTTLRIMTPGKATISLPGPPAPHPIPVHDAAEPPGAPAKYISLRATRRSGTATLVPGHDTSAAVLATTSYRFGPRRPPTLTLHGHGALSSREAARARVGRREADAEAATAGRDFATELTAPALSRTTTLDTPLGRFRWRYPSRAEKTDGDHGQGEGHDGRSRLLLERVASLAAGKGGRAGGAGRVVGCLVRGRGGAAGEGGGLQLGLAAADEAVAEALLSAGGAGATDEKEREKEKMAARDVLELVAVASCIAMLKREVDRLRLRQGLVLAGAAGGS